MNSADLPPLMRQYHEIKRAYRDAILFFRVGDFYEMFYEDAQEASSILSIALTSRDKSKPNPIPLCGVPYHAATGYIAKLLQAGRTVALCDQVEDAKLAKGLVRREVVRLYTPGTLTDGALLAPTATSVVAALSVASTGARRGSRNPVLGLAALELSTGEFWVSEYSGEGALAEVQDELTRIVAKELLYPQDLPEEIRTALAQLPEVRLCNQEPGRFERSAAEGLLLSQFGVATLAGFGCDDLTVAVQSAGAVLAYLRDTQRTATLGHVRRFRVRRSDENMHLDAVTIRNLELVASLMDNRGSHARPAHTLLSVLDRTVTVIGSRQLREWLVRPLVHVEAIQARLDAVAELYEDYQTRSSLRTTLRAVQDIIRLSTRACLGSASPRDLLALKESLAVLPEIGPLARARRASLFLGLTANWDDLRDVYDLIERAILPDASGSIRDGGIIKEGYSARLDELRKARQEGKSGIAQLEAQERDRTGIESLKVRYNQVFGYYIEITKANLNRIPDRYIRKQTLANAERFTTAELKDLETLVTGADEKVNRLEQELFEEVRDRVGRETPRIQDMGSILAVLDVVASLSETAALYQYVKPEMHAGGTIRVAGGRHPVVEQLASSGQGGFIPNDILLDLEANRLLVITGPNMAGKSTYLRQVGLIVLMAHIGSFVPAESASIGLVDRIFTRVGASDNLAEGQSTFMVEMTETAKILNCASPRSLILLDEIGRGTSTYDGLSIAWAVAEYIQDRRLLGARSLFATHYHEMTQLAALREGIRNYSVSVRERDGHVLFLRKIVEGGADRSYGIYVAKLAGLPASVIDRAEHVLGQLEQTAGNEAAPTSPDQPTQERLAFEQPVTPLPLDRTGPAPHPIVDEVRQMDLFSMTPLDALNRLAELKRRLEDEEATGLEGHRA